MDNISRKQRAFELFDQGKRPSDPEVRALKLKAGTIHGYFQEWKKNRELEGGKVVDTKTGAQAAKAEDKTGVPNEVEALKQENEVLRQENEALRSKVPLEGNQEKEPEKHLPEVVWDGRTIALKLEVVLPPEALAYFNIAKALGLETDGGKPFDEFLWDCVRVRFAKDYKQQLVLAPIAEEELHG